MTFQKCAAQVRELGSGQFGTTLLMQDALRGELVAVKFLPRSHKVTGDALNARIGAFHRLLPAPPERKASIPCPFLQLMPAAQSTCMGSLYF
jgi:hypothetical protein